MAHRADAGRAGQSDPLGHTGPEEAQQQDEDAVEQEDAAGVVDADLLGPQRQEGHEARVAQHGHGQHDARAEPGLVQERQRCGVSDDHGRGAHRGGQGAGDGRGDHREHRGQQEGLRVVGATGEQLAEHRPDAQAAEHRDREVARGLGPPARRCEVVDDRGRADEVQALAHAEEHAQHQEQRDRCEQRRERHGTGGQQRAGGHHPALAVATGRPCDQGPGGDGRHAVGRDGSPHDQAGPAQLVGDVAREGREVDPDGDEVGQRGRGDREERPADEPAGPVGHGGRIGHIGRVGRSERRGHRASVPGEPCTLQLHGRSPPDVTPRGAPVSARGAVGVRTSRGASSSWPRGPRPARAPAAPGRARRDPSGRHRSPAA